MRIICANLSLLALLACATAASGGQGVTTLADPSQPFEKVRDVSVVVEAGPLTAWLVTNSGIPPLHRPGYNGLLELRYKGGASPFVPDYAGLNLEHVNNGKAYPISDLQFEPRRHPMDLRKIDARTYDLYQPPLPETGLESCTRFSLREPHDLDVTFECIPRQEKFPFGYLNIFWASYIFEPEDKAITFMGRKKGATGEAWIEARSLKHGEAATHRGAGDKREFKREEPFPLTLVFNESEYEYTRPFYYARYRDMVWIVMFHAGDRIRFTQSPTGGGRDNPAWDFQWFIDAPRKDQLYGFSYRAVYRPWTNREDVLAEYDRFLGAK